MINNIVNKLVNKFDATDLMMITFFILSLTLLYGVLIRA